MLNCTLWFYIFVYTLCILKVKQCSYVYFKSCFYSNVQLATRVNIITMCNTWWSLILLFYSVLNVFALFFVSRVWINIVTFLRVQVPSDTHEFERSSFGRICIIIKWLMYEPKVFCIYRYHNYHRYCRALKVCLYIILMLQMLSWFLNKISF